jgi:signal transduction histidine kinase
MVGGRGTLGSCALVATRAERVWPKELILRFRLLTEVFAKSLDLKRAQETSRECERVLRENENDLRRLAGRLISAQEEERSRLARELHDDLAQRLAVLAIDVGRLERELTDPSTAVQKKLREMKQNFVDASKDIHNLSRQIHPAILDDLGLVRAVESECASFSKREGVHVAFNRGALSTAIPKDISLSLYRIVQEGLRNISKHACAEHVSVSLAGMDEDLLLSIRDDGIGFDSVAVSGVNYSDCGGVFYKAAFQGNNLVYVVVEKPLK